MKKIWILTWDNIKNSLRTRRAMIFLALYSLIFGLITYGFFQMQKHIEQEIVSQGISEFQKDFMLTSAKNVVENKTQDNFLMQFLFNVPVINIMLFFVSLIGTPMLIFIMNYDKISQEIYDGTIRYVLFRASRFQIYFAKFLSGMIECSLITLVALVLGVLWGSLKYASVDFGVSMTYGLRYWLIAQFFLAVFVSLSLMASAIFKKPFTSLLLCFIAYFAMPILAFFFPYVSPFEIEYYKGLFFHNSYQLLFSLLIYTAYSTVFFAIGYNIFKRKDL